MSDAHAVSSVPLYWSKVVLPVWTPPRGDTGLNR